MKTNNTIIPGGATLAKLTKDVLQLQKQVKALEISLGFKHADYSDARFAYNAKKKEVGELRTELAELKERYENLFQAGADAAIKLRNLKTELVREYSRHSGLQDIIDRLDVV